MEGRTQHQKNVQNTRRLNDSNFNHTNVRSSHDGGNSSAQKDINYDTEVDNTDESDDDDISSEGEGS
jgi:hypothetical protein